MGEEKEKKQGKAEKDSSTREKTTKGKRNIKKRQKQIDKWMARGNRPRDKIGRVIKTNAWGDEIVRVKNKWMLRSEVEGS